jgi:ketosteroid isomerase-like protein
MSKIESGMRVVLKFYEAFNQHDAEGMLALMSAEPSIETTSPTPDGTHISGVKAIKKHWQDFFQGTPQAQIDIEEIFGLGMRCVAYWKLEWLNTQGEVTYRRGVDIFMVKGGRISKLVSYVKG